MRCEFLLVLALCVAASQARSTRMRMLERMLDFLEERDDDDSSDSCECPTEFGQRGPGYCRPLDCYTPEELVGYAEEFKVDNGCDCPADLDCPTRPPGGPGPGGPSGSASGSEEGDGPGGPPEGQCPKPVCCLLAAAAGTEKRQGPSPTPPESLDDVDCDFCYDDLECPDEPPSGPPSGPPPPTSEPGECPLPLCCYLEANGLLEDAEEKKRATKSFQRKRAHMKRQPPPGPTPTGDPEKRQEDECECPGPDSSGSFGSSSVPECPPELCDARKRNHSSKQTRALVNLMKSLFEK